MSVTPSPSESAAGVVEYDKLSIPATCPLVTTGTTLIPVVPAGTVISKEYVAQLVVSSARFPKSPVSPPGPAHSSLKPALPVESVFASRDHV